MNTNLIALGALAVFCGISSGCTAAVYPNGTVMTSYAAPVVVEEPVVVVDPAPLMIVEKVRPGPLSPVLVSHHRPVTHHVSPAPIKPTHHVSPAPIKPTHHVSPARPAQPSRSTVAPKQGNIGHSFRGGGQTHRGGQFSSGGHSRGGGGSSHSGGSRGGRK